MNYSGIPALLRGLLRCGDIGPFVISRPEYRDKRAIHLEIKASEGEDIAPSLRRQLDSTLGGRLDRQLDSTLGGRLDSQLGGTLGGRLDRQLDKQASAQIAARLAEHSVFPLILSVSGHGSFYIAETYDEAQHLANTAPREEAPQVNKRAAGQPASPASPASSRAGGSGGRMEGRISLVTGGAQGFGEEIVRHLVREGAFVFIADINIKKALQLADDLNTEGISGASEISETQRTSAMALEVDVSREESIEAMAARVVAETGGLDLFINNAGVLRAGSVTEMSREDFDFVSSINYTAYFLAVKHIAPILILQNSARGGYSSDIIQINSKSGLQGSNKNAAYAGGKFGGIGLTQSFALELVAHTIKVNAVCPGNFFEGPLWSDPEKGLFSQYLKAGKVPGARTIEDVKAFYESKVPMGRGCRGEDLARAIFYIVEQKYETGQAIPVTGGQIMLA